MPIIGSDACASVSATEAFSGTRFHRLYAFTNHHYHLVSKLLKVGRLKRSNQSLQPKGRKRVEAHMTSAIDAATRQARPHAHAFSTLHALLPKYVALCMLTRSLSGAASMSLITRCSRSSRRYHRTSSLAAVVGQGGCVCGWVWLLATGPAHGGSMHSRLRRYWLPCYKCVQLFMHIHTSTHACM
jgi:hypothetical protein